MPGLGRVPSPPDPKDHPLALHVPRLAGAIAVLPPMYHSRYYGPVLNQGQTPRCVGYGSALVRTTTQFRDAHRLVGFDPDELYDECKKVDGWAGDGTYPRVALDILLHRGMKVATSPEAGEVGQFRKIEAYARLSSIDEVKVAIHKFGAAGIGSPWYRSWYTPGRFGVLPEPDVDDGGHFWTAVGWSDRRQALRGQNSWGPEWGSRGRFWVPYAFVGDLSDTSVAASWEAWRTIDLAND